MEKKHMIGGLVFLALLAVVALNDNKVINLTGNTITCVEGPLDNYRCYPLVGDKPFILQREYQYRTCQKRWFKLEGCSDGCNRVTKQCN